MSRGQIILDDFLYPIGFIPLFQNIINPIHFLSSATSYKPEGIIREHVPVFRDSIRYCGEYFGCVSPDDFKLQVSKGMIGGIGFVQYNFDS